MKNIYFLLILVCLCPLLYSEQVIFIENDQFHLASTNNNGTIILREYVLTNETIDNWSTLVSSQKYPKLKSPREYIQSLVNAYCESFPGMKYAASGDPRENIYWMDFIAYSKNDNTITSNIKYVEWCFFKAQKDKDKKVIVYQYSKRVKYEKKMKEAFDILKVSDLREKMVPLLINWKFEILNQ